MKKSHIYVYASTAAFIQRTAFGNSFAKACYRIFSLLFQVSQIGKLALACSFLQNGT